jgi:hypothetical protein
MCKNEYQKARKGYGIHTLSRKGYLKQQALPLQRHSWKWTKHDALHVNDTIAMKSTNMFSFTILTLR